MLLRQPALLLCLVLGASLSSQEEVEAVLRCESGVSDGQVQVVILDSVDAALPEGLALRVDGSPDWIAPEALRRVRLGHDDDGWRLVADLGPVADTLVEPDLASLPDGSDLAAKAAALARQEDRIPAEAAPAEPAQQPRISEVFAVVLDGRNPVLLRHAGPLPLGTIWLHGSPRQILATDGNYAVLDAGADLADGAELFLGVPVPPVTRIRSLPPRILDHDE